jgi:GH15 family glucan-1,4-alpha-glucosidase
MVRLQFLPADDPRLRATIDAIARELGSAEVHASGWDAACEMGSPSDLLATFWLVEALAGTGRVQDAKTALARAYGALSPLGLFAEGYDPRSLSMRGNFPHAPTHVGFLRAAFTASDSWADVV